MRRHCCPKLQSKLPVVPFILNLLPANTTRSSPEGSSPMVIVVVPPLPFLDSATSALFCKINLPIVWLVADTLTGPVVGLDPPTFDPIKD